MEPAELQAIFIERVTEKAEAKGLSLNRLGDFAGVSRGYMSMLMRAQKMPTIAIVAKLAAALEVEPWELLRVGKTRK